VIRHRVIWLDSGHRVIRHWIVWLDSGHRVIWHNRTIRLGRHIKLGRVHWVIGHQGIRLNHGRRVLRRQADWFGYWQDGIVTGAQEVCAGL
ncbi:unnamed protein product, partial [Staurois parvus]